MSENSSSRSAELYVVRASVVREALARLSALSLHRALTGYLVLLRTAGEVQRIENLKPDFKGFFDRYFAIGGSPSKLPYYVAFGSAGHPEERFFNRNVAGSYAPSSIRPVNPLRRLASIEATPTGHVFGLVPDHADVARDLLQGVVLPGASLAAYLYRDFGFESPERPEASELYSLLKEEFGYAFASGHTAFGNVFTDDTAALGQPFELRSATS